MAMPMQAEILLL